GLGRRGRIVRTNYNRQWLSAYTYNGIRARLTAEDALAAGPTPGGGGASGGPPDRRFPEKGPTTTEGQILISVVARVNLTKKEGQIRHVHPLAVGVVQQPASGSSVLLRLKGAGGQVLAEHRVAVKIDSCLDGSGDQTGLVDAIIAAGPNARQIELVIGDQLADTFRSGGQGPAAPAVRRSAGPEGASLSWEGGARVGTEGLTYAVQASTDEG